MRLRRAWIGAVAAFAAAASCFGAAHADGGAPSAGELRALREACGGRTAIVWSAGRRYALPRPAFDSTGAWSRDPRTYRTPRVAVVELPGAARAATPPRPLRWDAIDSVGVDRHVATAAVLGVAAAAGVVLGFVAMGGVFERASGSRDAAVRFAVAVPFGVGAALATGMLLPDPPPRVLWRAR